MCVIVVQSEDYYCYGVLKEHDMEEEESRSLVAVLGGKTWKIWSHVKFYNYSQFIISPPPLTSHMSLKARDHCILRYLTG
jgi:hypothetical protein